VALAKPDVSEEHIVYFSSEKSVLARATRRHISEHVIIHSYRRRNLNSYDSNSLQPHEKKQSASEKLCTGNDSTENFIGKERPKGRNRQNVKAELRKLPI
jgi:hypothetical protein